MFIQTQDTPNPATLKFIPGVPVMEQGTADFSDSKSSDKSPLARRLFQIDGVTASGLPIVENDADIADPHAEGEDSDTVQQIKQLLDSRVRPAVAMDGGDIVFQGFDDGIVTLQMRGACQGCPSSTATLKMGIENMLRHYIPEVREVRAAEL